MTRLVPTSLSQFGFKSKHGTDMCIFALKEILDGRHVVSITAIIQ